MPQKSHPLMTKTIYLIRHGQTDFNRLGIVQGSGVDTQLNETGRKQAECFYEAYRHIPFERIYTTELRRTQESVEPFALQTEIPIERLAELNEINWGYLEGKTPTKKDKALFFDTLERWAAGQLDHAIAGGETPLEMLERQKRGLERIMAGPESTVLVCMHGRAMRSFLCLMTGQNLKDMDQFEHGNLCLYVLEKSNSDEHFTVIKSNDQSHLRTLD
ncbi:MAG: histidine phosphatase family protein [Bacteroidia bacterium]